VPDDVRDLLDDVDLLGNDISVFCRNWFREGVAKALCHVFVDFSRGPDFDGRTLADDQAEGVRPYWLLISPDRVLSAHAETINGKETLTHLRWLEQEVVQVGFAQKVVDRIRVFDLVETFENESENEEVSKDFKTQVRVRLYEWVDRSPQGRRVKPRWTLVSEDFMDIDEIPLVTFYASRLGFMVGKPPISDLCDLNVRWWQSNSDQIAILTVSRFPMLAASGVSDTDDLIIGPNNWLGMEAPNGRFYYVEHEGKAIGAGDTDLDNLEEQMANYGADFLKKRPGSPTATARALDSAEATSPLQDVAVRFEDAMENLLRLTHKWNRLAGLASNQEDFGGSASVITEYGPEEVEQVHASLLTFARKNNDLSRTKFLELLQEFGSLPPGFDMEENARLLEQEQEQDLARMVEQAAALEPEDDEDDEDEPPASDRTDNKSKPSDED
jgi:hypothetical protein